MLKKIAGPGFFRLFLALMVFVYHTTRFAVGSSAVYVFFCLSGYWIYRMYTERYSATRQPLITYAVSRLWRLLPTFWLVTLLALTYLFFAGALPSYWNETNRVTHRVKSIHLWLQDSAEATDRARVVSGYRAAILCVAPFLAMLFAWKKLGPGWNISGFAAISLASFLLDNPVSLMKYLVYFATGMAAA